MFVFEMSVPESFNSTHLEAFVHFILANYFERSLSLTIKFLCDTFLECQLSLFKHSLKRLMKAPKMNIP